MRCIRSRNLCCQFLVLAVCLGWVGIGSRGSLAAPATGQRGVIASVHPLATAAGVNAYRAGGNAVDAAIAAALTLGVVDSHNSGLGGGCFILVRTPQGQFLAVDGRERAPAAATPTMYLRNGIADAQLSQTGPLAVAVPGALAAYAHALERLGRRPLPTLLEPAAALAAHGFPIDAVMARNLATHAELLQRFPATASILLHADGRPRAAGDTLVQADLAATYRSIAAHGPGWFYAGPFATQTARWMREQGGLLTEDDFRQYHVVEREPLITRYRDCTVVGFPPPSSGGVHVAQVLQILAAFDLRALHAQDPAAFAHVIAEAMKLAFADRAHWLGDSDYVNVPRGLIDPSYGRRLAQRIDLHRAGTVDAAGQPPDTDPAFFSKHTTHIAAADDEGYWVAITATINTSFGAKVMVPGTGLLLNNEMDDFSIQPGVPNAFGLIGSQQNEIAPGKRPLSSMSPTIVLRDGQPILSVGAAGGPKIITQVILAIIQVVDLQRPLEDAIAQPRWHHQWRPDRLYVEPTLPQRVRDGLTQRGHRLEELSSGGVMQGVERTAAGQFIGVHDPRVPGQAASFDP